MGRQTHQSNPQAGQRPQVVPATVEEPERGPVCLVVGDEEQLRLPGVNTLLKPLVQHFPLPKVAADVLNRPAQSALMKTLSE